MSNKGRNETFDAADDSRTAGFPSDLKNNDIEKIKQEVERLYLAIRKAILSL